MRKRWSLWVPAVLLAGCGGRTVTDDLRDAAPGVDVLGDPDTGPLPPPSPPTPPPTPPPPTADVPLPPRDAPPTADAPLPPMPVPDGGPGVDAPTPVDTGLPPPPPPPPPPGPDLSGRWRAVAWESLGPPALRLTDRNTPIPDPMTGRATPLRANGVLNLATSRLSLAFGILANDHFYPYSDARTAEGFSAEGFTVPGRLDSRTGTFSIPGNPTPIRLQLQPDGRLVLDSPEDRTRVTLERAPVLVGLPELLLGGAAIVRDVARFVPLAHPRVALFWEVPTRDGRDGYNESYSAALTFTMGYAAFFITRAGPPPESARHRVGGSAVAVGWLGVYDDRDDSRTYNGADRLRTVSPIAIAWLAEGRSSAPGFEDLASGYNLVHQHPDYVTGTVGLTPFDATNPVSPDIPVPLRDADERLPDLLR